MATSCRGHNQTVNISWSSLVQQFKDNHVIWAICLIKPPIPRTLVTLAEYQTCPLICVAKVIIMYSSSYSSRRWWQFYSMSREMYLLWRKLLALKSGWIRWIPYRSSNTSSWQHLIYYVHVCHTDHNRLIIVCGRTYTKISRSHSKWNQEQIQ